MTQICEHCNAIFFRSENSNKCCGQGRRNLQFQFNNRLPELIRRLLRNNNSFCKEFRLNIRRYNSSLAMTSCGAKLDHLTRRDNPQDRLGVYVYKINGEMYHQIWTMIPMHGEIERFLQLYFIDAGEHLRQLNGNAIAGLLNSSTLEQVRPRSAL